MPGNPREMVTMAERRFPVGIKVGVPPGGLGQRYSEITAWLDQNCGADSWAITPSGVRGVLNDAISIYFADGSPAPLLPGGAKGQRRRLPGVCSRCARMNLRRGLGRHCTGRREGWLCRASTQLSAQSRCCWLMIGRNRPNCFNWARNTAAPPPWLAMTAPYSEDFTAMMGTLLE